MILVLAGFLAGLLHVLSGPDHLAAIAPYAVDGKAQAWQTGMRWGIGHSTGVLVIGLLALLLRGTFPVDLLSGYAERCVGIVLLAIGLWGGRRALALRAGAQSPLAKRGGHAHHHESFAVGSVHGLAGSSHLLGIVPALALPSRAAAIAYLVLFGAGTIVAMSGFASLVGWLSGRPAAQATAIQSGLAAVCSAIAIVVGVAWLIAPGS